MELVSRARPGWVAAEVDGAFGGVGATEEDEVEHPVRVLSVVNGCKGYTSQAEELAGRKNVLHLTVISFDKVDE